MKPQQTLSLDEMFKKGGIKSPPDWTKINLIRIRSDGGIYFAGQGKYRLLNYKHSKKIYFINPDYTKSKSKYLFAWKCIQISILKRMSLAKNKFYLE